MPQLKNKIAVVTGGTSGIGLATAKRFVEEGAFVFIAGRRQAELDKAVAEIGSNVTGVKADISNGSLGIGSTRSSCAHSILDRQWHCLFTLRPGSKISRSSP